MTKALPYVLSSIASLALVVAVYFGPDDPRGLYFLTGSIAFNVDAIVVYLLTRRSYE